MALFTGNAAADLNISSLFYGVNGSNINTNSGSQGLDISNYIGIIAVAHNVANGGDVNTQYQMYLSTSNDANRSNSTNIAGTTFTNGTNLSTGLQVLGVDTRLCKKYLFANWIVSGTGSTIFADATVIGQAKYKVS